MGESTFQKEECDASTVCLYSCRIVAVASLGTSPVFAIGAENVDVQADLWAGRYEQAIETAKASHAEVEGGQENTAEALRLRLQV